MDGLDAIKRNQRIKDVVAASVQDGFPPAKIADAVKASHRPEAAAELTAARKYQLPCRDIWVQYILFNTLQEEHFTR